MKTHFITMTLRRQLQFLACAIAMSLLASCASNNYQRGATVGAGLRASADKINQDRYKIDAVTNSLNDLANNPGDLAAQFKKYSAAVSGFESVTREVNSKVNAISKQGDAYFAVWDQQAAQIQNEDLRNRSAAHRAEMQEKFADIKKSYEEAQNDIKPFISGLKDIQTALSTDLTPGGVDAIKQSAGKVINEGSSLKSTLSKLAGQFRDLGVAMSASVPQPALDK